ncbi:MAG: hypothetical protein K9N21_06515 [Deltaproteobacteria bacterium]|nr:hypothetical protein [Deltaproteobacteria bacterium]
MTAYLQITLNIRSKNRSAAAEIYGKYREPFLTRIKGARTKHLLVRDEDVQVLHGFEKTEDAQAYLESDLFTEDVVEALKPLLEAEPDIRIYYVAG